ncbi:MAG: hypothetical protein F9K32_13105 [Desulfobulbaceae bacterium]|nr:MAG: hypothetical protein F9K32_13105 [Desulfobulbaceae bacterium]
MALPGKEWYSVEEVAEIIDCNVDDIIYFIHAGIVEPLLWFENEPATWEDGKGSEQHAVILNGLYASLIPLKYPLHGSHPVIYSVELDSFEESFSKAFLRVFDSFEDALKCREEVKKDCLPEPFILSHPKADKWLATWSLLRFNGESKTAKKVILKGDVAKIRSIVGQAREENLSFDQPEKDSRILKKSEAKIEKTNMLIIAAIIRELQESGKIKSKAELIDALEKKYRLISGISKTNLDKRFAEAERILLGELD